MILTNETECPENYDIELFPITYKRWYEQNLKTNRKKMFLKSFNIEPMKFELSIIFKTKKSLYREMEFVGPLRYLKSSGLSLINVDEAAFKMKGFKREKLFIGQDDFNNVLSSHYLNNVIRELKKLTFSLGFFGSPRTMYKYVKEGCSDFVTMPREGYQRGGVISGAAGTVKGTLSFGKNVGVGIMSSIQVLNSSLS